jgi:Cft2 family RNA processing exonuclease
VAQTGESLDAPRVIVTSTASLEYGFTRKILKDFICKPKNEILFLQLAGIKSSLKKTLGHRLLVDGEKEFITP